MARVPQQETRTVATQAIPTVFQSSREATIDVFGGAEAAQALQSGKQLSAAADDLGRIALTVILEDNEREVKRGDTNIRRQLNLLLYGDGTRQNPGYLSTRNDEALSAHADTLEALNSIVATELSTAGNSNIAAGISAGSAIPVTTALENIARHANKERRSSSILTINRRVEQAENDAAADSNRLDESKVIAKNEALAICALDNLTAEQCDGPINDNVSKVIDAAVRGELSRPFIVDAEGVSGIERAEIIFEEAKRLNEINGLMRTPLEKAILAAKISRVDAQIKLDILATKKLKEEQDQNLGDLLVELRRENPGITSAFIAEQFAADKINRSGMEKAFKFLDAMRGPATGDRPETLVALSQMRDDNILIREDIEEAFMSRRITTSTFDREIERLNNSDRLLDTPQVRRLRRSLVEYTVGGLTGPFTMLDPDARQRAGLISDQFDERILAKEDPQAVFDSLRTNPSFVPVRSPFPTAGERQQLPLFLRGVPGSITSADFDEMYKLTEEAKDDGRLIGSAYSVQVNIIRDLEAKAALRNSQ